MPACRRRAAPVEQRISNPKRSRRQILYLVGAQPACGRQALLRPIWRSPMRLGNFRISVLFCSTLIFFAPCVHAQRKAPPDPAKPKIRAITAFINLDRAQYQQQIADALTMLKRARTTLESRDFEVETIRITTQPFSE